MPKGFRVRSPGGKTKKRGEKSFTKDPMTKLYDLTYSWYRRLSESDANGICKCCSCNKFFYWKSETVGHWQNRSTWQLRYFDLNVWPQCRQCNFYKEGNQIVFTRHLIDNAGVLFLDVFDHQLASAITPSAHDMITHMEEMREKIKKLLMHKNLWERESSSFKKSINRKSIYGVDL